jgi:hypothetical protein
VLDAFAGVIGAVAVIPLWDGPGTVKVLVLEPGGTLPSAPVLAEVQAYLDTWAPIGADVTVAAPTVLAVDVRATVTIGDGFSWGDVEANARLAIAAYLDGLGLGEDALLAAEGDALWRTSGVGGSAGRDGGNYTALQQRVSPAAFAAADIAAADTEKIVTGTITLTEA